MHRLLKRQLKRHHQGTVPEAFRPLLQAISDAYEQADVDREMLERSLALTAEELLERHQRLSQHLLEQQSLLDVVECQLLEKVHHQQPAKGKNPVRC